MHAAFRRVCISKMLFQIGKGGDRKEMEAILDKALFGELEISTLDCGVFLDRAEFRKSAELAWNRANVRIQRWITMVALSPTFGRGSWLMKSLTVESTTASQPKGVSVSA